MSLIMRRIQLESGPIADAVLRHGREFIGIVRPKGFRHQRRRKQCFLNAADVAQRNRAQYVEGFVIRRNGWSLFHHAWITLDGEHAIDQTLSGATNYNYFGIVFPLETLRDATAARQYYGILQLLLEQPDKAAEILGFEPVEARLPPPA